MKSKIVILMLASLMLTGCGITSTYTYKDSVNLQEDWGEGYFTIIKQWGNSRMTHNIVYANDTQVKYYICWYHCREEAGTSITPLYNADGSLQIYEGE